MAIQVICDRCKCVINNYKSYQRAYEIYNNGNEVDLCRSCYLDIMRIIESQPIFSKNTNEEKEN